MEPQPPCPECEKLSAVANESNIIAQFMDWMIDETPYRICSLAEEREEWGKFYTSTYGEREQLLAQYFDIDLNKVEKERRALLEWLREAQEEN